MKNEIMLSHDWEFENLFPGLSENFSTVRHFSRVCMQKIQALKEAITAELSQRFAGEVRPDLLRKAINEADALAATTDFPALVLPALAEEKALEMARWESKQREIRQRGSLLAA